jgi:hypothetical protein
MERTQLRPGAFFFFAAHPKAKAMASMVLELRS